MITRCLTIIGLIAALSISSGCGGGRAAQKGTMVDKNWGKSLEAAKFNQRLNPQASKNLNPVVGLDGQAAENILQRYNDDSEGGPAEETYNLNLGNIDSIGKK
jgi:hypothetical protein